MWVVFLRLVSLLGFWPTPGFTILASGFPGIRLDVCASSASSWLMLCTWLAVDFWAFDFCLMVLSVLVPGVLAVTSASFVLVCLFLGDIWVTAVVALFGSPHFPFPTCLRAYVGGELPGHLLLRWLVPVLGPLAFPPGLALDSEVSGCRFLLLNGLATGRCVLLCSYSLFSSCWVGPRSCWSGRLVAPLGTVASGFWPRPPCLSSLALMFQSRVLCFGLLGCPVFRADFPPGV